MADDKVVLRSRAILMASKPGSHNICDERMDRCIDDDNDDDDGATDGHVPAHGHGEKLAQCPEASTVVCMRVHGLGLVLMVPFTVIIWADGFGKNVAVNLIVVDHGRLYMRAGSPPRSTPRRLLVALESEVNMLRIHWPRICEGLVPLVRDGVHIAWSKFMHGADATHPMYLQAQTMRKECPGGVLFYPLFVVLNPGMYNIVSLLLATHTSEGCVLCLQPGVVAMFHVSSTIIHFMQITAWGTSLPAYQEVVRTVVQYCKTVLLHPPHTL